MKVITTWEHPDSYAAFDDSADPVGHYVIATQHRDSDALDRSNYARIFEDLTAAAEEHGAPDCLYDFRASHWAVGWVEYLILRNDAPAAVIEMAEGIAAALADYPVYDETAWSDLEWNEAAEYWENMSVRDRAEVIRSHGRCSLFAARHDSVPDDCGVYDYLRG